MRSFCACFATEFSNPFHRALANSLDLYSIYKATGLGKELAESGKRPH